MPSSTSHSPFRDYAVAFCQGFSLMGIWGQGTALHQGLERLVSAMAERRSSRSTLLPERNTQNSTSTNDDAIIADFISTYKSCAWFFNLRSSWKTSNPESLSLDKLAEHLNNTSSAYQSCCSLWAKTGASSRKTLNVITKNGLDNLNHVTADNIRHAYCPLSGP